MSSIPRTGAPLRVAQISFFADPAGRSPQALLEAWPSMVDIARAAQGAGAEVTVVQASRSAGRLQADGVDYQFVPATAGMLLANSSAMRALLDERAPQVLHVHGLGFLTDLAALAASHPGIPILLQDHANPRPPWWRWAQWRRGLAPAAGVAFCARAQAEPFRRARLLRASQRIYEVPESTSRFTPGEQAAGRAASGLSGEPCVLWVGRLDANKDPLTVLAGFAEASNALPRAQLWCFFGDAPLLEAVTRRVHSDPRLRGRVHLKGRVPHEHIAHAMRAADLLVLGSHHEGSGYALIEALACGLPAAVTDIPSFRALLGDAGVLWRCGDARGCAAALLELARRPPAAARAAARVQFERELSFAAMGRKLVSAYADLRDALSGAAVRA